MRKAILLLIIVAAFLVPSCKKGSDPQTSGTPYLDLPLTPYNYQNGSNTIATLGRVLFYDRHLSLNNSVACADCHKQTSAFADNAAFSRGFENKLTGRNSIAIQNLRFGGQLGFNTGSGNLFWDGREDNITNLITRPITNHVEMGITDPAILPEKLAALPYYRDLFMAAFNDSGITVDRISMAVASFSSSIMATNSRFDQYNQGVINMTALELEGLQLFEVKYNCSNCHNESFSGYSGGTFADIGLDASYIDKGKGNVTGKSSDNGLFKVPNLRNVALTAPYMHDGRFATLEQVLDHYSHGINGSTNLDFRLKDANKQPMRMNISVHEKQALIAFLNTLTDYDMITAAKYSNPFKIK